MRLLLWRFTPSNFRNLTLLTYIFCFSDSQRFSNATKLTMNEGNYSDLPEYYVGSHQAGPAPGYYAASSQPRMAPPTPPLKTPPRPLFIQQRPPMPHSPRDSHLSAESPQSSRLTLRTMSSGRTSITAADRHQNHINIGIDFGTT
jgi:hypothetical protein